MSALNPYAGFLDGRPIRDILAATPSAIAGLIETIGPSKIAAVPYFSPQPRFEGLELHVCCRPPSRPAGARVASRRA